MAGGLMQLVAYGAQDVYLTGQPKVTFFQAVYKRHTNFAMETIQQTVNGTAAANGRVSVTIARNGDLVGDMYVAMAPATGAASLALVTNNSTADAVWLAERAIAAVELTIGGQRIDKHYQTWFRLYAEVFLAESDKINYGKMCSTPQPTNNDGTNRCYVYLPLLFFFNRNPGLFLPLIALQYHEVRLDFDLTAYYGSFFGTSSPVFEVWANYVYLDTEERRRFAQKGHEYLIEQVQHTGGDTITAGSITLGGSAQAQTIRLSYNHPVKELVWCYQSVTNPTTAFNAMWNFSTSTSNVNLTVSSSPGVVAGVMPHAIGAPHLYSNTAFMANTLSNAAFTSNIAWVEEGTANVYGGVVQSATGALTANPLACEVGPLYNFKLVLNGQDRFKEQLGKYFNQYQPYVYHSGTPYPGIYVYSFALQPEEHQPTGTCNFSRIDNAQVAINIKGGVAQNTVAQKMFAVNYNILRIQSGMGGLAFSN